MHWTGAYRARPASNSCVVGHAREDGSGEARILLSARGERVMSPTTRREARVTWEFPDLLANSLLFLLMGLAVGGAVLAPGERLGDQLIQPLLVALSAVVPVRTRSGGV